MPDTGAGEELGDEVCRSEVFSDVKNLHYCINCDIETPILRGRRLFVVLKMFVDVQISGGANQTMVALVQL